MINATWPMPLNSKVSKNEETTSNKNVEKSTKESININKFSIENFINKQQKLNSVNDITEAEIIKSEFEKVISKLEDYLLNKASDQFIKKLASNIKAGVVVIDSNDPLFGADASF